MQLAGFRGSQSFSAQGGGYGGYGAHLANPGGLGGYGQHGSTQSGLGQEMLGAHRGKVRRVGSAPTSGSARWSARP